MHSAQHFLPNSLLWFTLAAFWDFFFTKNLFFLHVFFCLVCPLQKKTSVSFQSFMSSFSRIKAAITKKERWLSFIPNFSGHWGIFLPHLSSTAEGHQESVLWLPLGDILLAPSLLLKWIDCSAHKLSISQKQEKGSIFEWLFTDILVSWGRFISVCFLTRRVSVERENKSFSLLLGNSTCVLKPMQGFNGNRTFISLLKVYQVSSIHAHREKNLKWN